MQIGMGPLVGTLAGSIGGTIGALGAIETIVYANKYIFLPTVEYGVSSIYGAMGEDRLRTQQEIEYARNTYFNPFFDKVTGINNTLKEYIETYTGQDLDGDGFIGKSESIKTNDRSKQLIGQIDKGNQQNGFAYRNITKVGPTGSKATKISDGENTKLVGSNPTPKYIIDSTKKEEMELKPETDKKDKNYREFYKRYQERTRRDETGSKNDKLYNALVGDTNNPSSDLGNQMA